MSGAEHHELCFGCGTANLFGLHIEDGRFFVKQDHQGPDGALHPGILAAGLLEVLGPVARVELELRGAAPVGTFVSLEVEGTSAYARGDDGSILAVARVGGERG
jgi:hypothetical protein